MKRTGSSSDTIFSIFESIWLDLYRYVTQNLNPKMTVSKQGKHTTLVIAGKSEETGKKYVVDHVP